MITTDGAYRSAIEDHGGVDLGPLLRYWHAQDEGFAHVESFWWGAVVSDARFPAIQEANYARVETRELVRLAEVEEVLVPTMARTALGRTHVLVFFPEEQTGLLAEASTRGERLLWDLVMEHAHAPIAPGDAVVEEAWFDEEAVASGYRASMRWFEVTDPAVLEQVSRVERTVMLPAGRRWFVVRHEGEPVAFAALLVLEGVGYVDHVVTFPEARGRGYASALTARAVAAAREAGADRTYLMAEPEGAARRIYERLGFRPVTQIASWIAPPTT